MSGDGAILIPRAEPRDVVHMGARERHYICELLRAGRPRDRNGAILLHHRLNHYRTPLFEVRRGRMDSI